MSLLLLLLVQSSDLERRVQEQLEREMKSLRAEVRDIIARELAAQDEAPDVLGIGGTDPEALAKALDLLSPDLLREILGTLADDKLEGRGTGTEGNNQAAEYIAGKFKEAGLTPVGDKDGEGRPTYFQHFSAGRRETQNVVGLLEGTDEKLKAQIVVLGGHYDHLGASTRGKDGDTIFNGADDNGSGSATVTALATAFGKAGLRTKRSILFIAFSGEEMGLLGSRHYVRNPLFEKERHACMLNLDMVGRNPEDPVTIMGVGHAKEGALDAITRASVERTGLTHTISQESSLGFGDSDHSSFRDEGIPAMFFFTGLHPDYHQLGDHVDKIAFERMDQIGETALFVLLGMGNREKDFAFRGPRQLGVMPKRVNDADLDAAGLGADQGALEITSVTAGSVGAAAGIEVGDWILSFGGETIPRGRRGDRTLRNSIKAAGAGEATPVKVRRDDKEVALTVRFDD